MSYHIDSSGLDEQRTVLQAAAWVGAEVRRSVVANAFGQPHEVGEVITKDGWHAARFLLALSYLDAHKPALGALARELRGACDTAECFVRKAVAFVKKYVRFVREEGEVFQGPAYTLMAGYGDCDDHARLLYAILLAGGIDLRLAFLHAGGDPKHVAVQAKICDEWKCAWTWAETTVDADLGEHPFAAASRLRLLSSRDDIATEVTTMTISDLPPSTDPAPASDGGETIGAITPNLTAHLSDGFFQQVIAMADDFRAKGATVSAADWLNVLLVESNVRPSAVNAQSGCAGLNQICNLSGVGWTGTRTQYLALSAEDQFPWARRYFEGAIQGRHAMLTSTGQLYLLNFSPAWLGSPDSKVMYRSGQIQYTQNQGVDFGGKGYIEVGDMSKFMATGPARQPAYWAELMTRLQQAGWTPDPGFVQTATPFVMGAVALGAAWFAARYAGWL